MKKIIVCLSVLLMATFQSFSQGIVFETGTFAEVLAKARKENKPVFIDFYTDWCGPCKKMSADVFMQSNVGDLFNKNFINYKIDAEKGEGVEIAKKYGVSAYPTMIWMDSEGKQLHKILGARDMESFVNEAKIMESSKDFGGLEEMKKKFESENNDPAFLLQFYNLFPRNDKMRPAIALRYLKSIPDEVLFDQDNGTDIIRMGDMITEINRFDPGFFYRFVDGIKKVKEQRGDLTAEYNSGMVFNIEQTTGKLMEAAINTGNEPFLEELITYKEYWPVNTITKNSDPDWDLLNGRGIFFASSDFLRLEFMRVNEKEENFRKAIVPYMDKMMKETPKGTWVTPYFDVELFLKVIKESMQGKSKDAIQMRVQTLLKHRARSIDSFTRWADYYWRISPSDAKTKKQIAGWLDYVVAINPYYVNGPLNSSALLVKIGSKELAVTNLENSIAAFREIYLDDSEQVKKLERMLRDVKNDKVY